MVVIFLSFVLCAQKNGLFETVLLSTHYICFDSEIKKLIFNISLLSKDLSSLKALKKQQHLFLLML